MLLQRSKLAAQRTERPYLAPRWFLLLLGGLIVVALIMIYPEKSLVQNLADAPSSELSSAYLANLLRTDPDNPRLRLLQASQALEHGDLGALRDVLGPTLDAEDPALRREARWLLWRAAEQTYKGLPLADNVRRLLMRQQMIRQLSELSGEDWPIERQVEIASQAFVLGEPEVGLALYRQAASRSRTTEESAERLAKGARTALDQGQYRSSAELYRLARRKTTDPAQAKAYFLAAARALQSGNLPGDALAMAEQDIGDLAEDREALFFIVQLARAAGHPEVADRYVRRLLRLSLLRQLQQLRLAAAHGGALPQKVALHAEGPQLPFDDKVYTLGYEVFLENRKLEDAWKVAASAVRQVPDDTAWRERLAKVAEWTGRPDMALEQWWQLARRTQRDDAWQSVLRLAPGLLNDAALIDALQYQLAKQPGDLRLLRELVATWERQGEPRAALDYLAHYYRRHGQPQVLAMTAELADRGADPDLALRTWQRLFELPGEATPSRLLKAASLALLQGDHGQALRWLELARSDDIPHNEEERAILRLTGQLATLEQRDETAIRALTRLSQSELAEETDFDALVSLLNDASPLEAARVAVRAWERFGQPRQLIVALGLYAGQERWEAIGNLLGRMAPTAAPPYNTLPELRRRADFLRLSGSYYQNTGHPREARRDLAAALVLLPASYELQTAMLWLLIDGNDAAGLRRFIARHEADWRDDPSMHDGLAAAYLALARPKIALERYLTPHLDEHRKDFLWLMNYADALEQNQQSDRAWRLRRHLLESEWQSLKAVAANRPENLSTLGKDWLRAGNPERSRRLARARLVLSQGSGDWGLEILRELLRLDRDADNNYSDAAVETAIGWWQGVGEYSAERGYLWQQYARSRGKAANRPLWAEISVALADNDTAALRPLLEQDDERLPRHDRINAALRLGDTRLAQSDAFATLDDQSDDDQLHTQLVETLLAFSDHADTELAHRQLAVIDEELIAAAGHFALTPKLALAIRFGSLPRSDRDTTIIRNVPGETFAGLQIDWAHDSGETTVLAEKRHSLSDYTPLQIEHEHRIDNRLSLRVALGQHLVSQESIALRVAGMKDRLAFNLNYQPTRVDRIGFEQLVERYMVQTGSPVGSGTHSTFTFDHALRQDNRDLEIGAFWSTHRFNREPAYSDPALAPLLPIGVAGVGDLQASFFLPDNFDFYGLRLTTDMRYEEQYTRALRPYGSIASTWHSQFGAGYDVRLGLAGSLFGSDHFSLTWGQTKAGLQTGDLTRELTFNYRLHY